MAARREAWLQLSAGVAGDMLLGALIDAGAPLAELRAVLAGLHLPGWSLEAEQVVRAGLRSTLAVVSVSDDATERRWSEIDDLIAGADLPPRVAERSRSALRRLAEVEADLHGTSVEEVHLHEVGGHDAIIDVVGTMAALELLGVDSVRASAVGLGSGRVRSAHGTLPSPAPATARLLEGLAVLPLEVELETATPTGAAIVASLAASGPRAPMALEATGLGAGSRDLPGHANVVGVLLGTVEDPSIEPVVLLSCNVDDLSGEQMGAAITALLAAGALDAWITPITMKKGRPGMQLELLCEPSLTEELSAEAHRLAGSLGLRRSVLERSVLERSTEVVELEGISIRIKRSAVTAKPEFDDVLAASEALGLSPAQVALAVDRLIEGFGA